MSFRSPLSFALGLNLSWVIACGAPVDDRDGGSQSGGQANASGGATGVGGDASTGGAVGTGGGLPTGGASATGGATGSGGTPSTGGTSSGCTPNPSGSFVATDDAVLDETTCLYWHKATTTGNFDAVTQACDASTAGGFDDWRIPNVDELASIVKFCKDWSKSSPWADAFEVSGDGYWTTTVAEDDYHYCAIGTATMGGYYEYGPVGPQVGRCVRGAGSPPAVMDCTTAATGCDNW